MNKLLVLGDLHVDDTRKQAIDYAWESIAINLNKQNTKFDSIVLLGDIFNKFPTESERLTFVDYLECLQKWSKKIKIVQGTGRHAYTNGLWHLQDMAELAGIEYGLTLEEDKYIFIHNDIEGIPYSSGHICEEGVKLSKYKGKTVIAGHYHTALTTKNLVIVGSTYKWNFAEKNDDKRFIIINDDKIISIPIASRPMYEINLIGDKGKVACPEIKLLKELAKDSEIDLKIIATTDSETLSSIHSNILKIKNRFKIEYYQDSISIEELKVKAPKSLDEKTLLKNYCKEKSVDYKLAEKEL